MEIQISFVHSDNGGASVNMILDNQEPREFDYASFTKIVFENPGCSITTNFDSTYTESQKSQLENMVEKIKSSAAGVNASLSPEELTF